MKKSLEILKKVSLFQDMATDEIELLLSCLKSFEKEYNKNDIIFFTGDPVVHVGIMLSGEAQITREDIMGNSSILTRIETGDTFAETFSCAGIKTFPVTVTAVTSCKVLFIDYKRIITTCPSTCNFHNKLIENMLLVLARKNILLNSKIQHLSKRTTREKLLSFLMEQATKQKNSSFTIPFDRQQLADYLCVDRSAMAKELGRLRDEGILSFHKNEFKFEK